MSLAEAVPVVSETHQATPPVVMPGSDQSRRRISADSFRNLTARLKTTNLVPTVAPAVMPAPEAVPAANLRDETPTTAAKPEPVPPQVAAAAAWPDIPDMEIPQPAAVAEPIIHEAPSDRHNESPVKTPSLAETLEALSRQIPDEAPEQAPLVADELPAGGGPTSLEPAISEPILADPVVSEPRIDVPVIPAPELDPSSWQVSESDFKPISPVSGVKLVEDPPPSKANVWETLAPKIESIAATPPPVIERSFPELVNPLDVMAAEEAARKAEEERLKAEAAARAALHPPRDAEEEARRLAALAESHVLENIWRQLLATPTNEDKAAYLVEAREIMGEEALVPPAEEHDLSRIEPAADLVVDVQQDLPETAGEMALEEPAPVGPVDDEADSASISLLEQTGDTDAAEFARSLLDMMAAGSSSGLPHERALAADTLLRLLPRLELKPLVMLSHRLAMMEAPPQLLVAKLIRDPRVEVSGPLLEDCMHLTDRDILMVIEENQADKLRMIARRRRLSRAISDALIATGETSVMLTLVRNMEAEISHDGFNTLIEAGDAHPDLLAPLCTRTDLSAPFAFELFWHAPAQLRRYLLTRFLTDSETLSKILKITMATKDGDEASDIEPLSQHVILEALDRASRGKLEPACDELSAAMQVDPKTIMRILTDTQGEPLAIMLKVASYPRSALPGLLQRLQEAELPLISAERDLDELQALFDTLSFNKARILLTYWDWATTKTGPYAPVH